MLEKAAAAVTIKACFWGFLCVYPKMTSFCDSLRSLQYAGLTCYRRVQLEGNLHDNKRPIVCREWLALWHWPWLSVDCCGSCLHWWRKLWGFPLLANQSLAVRSTSERQVDKTRKPGMNRSAPLTVHGRGPWSPGLFWACFGSLWWSNVSSQRRNYFGLCRQVNSQLFNKFGSTLNCKLWQGQAQKFCH